MVGCRTAVLAALFWGSACCRPELRPVPSELPESAEPPPEANPPRCVREGKEHKIGDGSQEATDAEEFLPFATEVGEGVATSNGFAVGALTKEGKGTAAVVAVVDVRGESMRLVSLGASHGDAEPPRVFSGSDALIGAGMLEPSGASRSLRLARVDGESVQWGAEFLQGNDESLAFDVALHGERGVAVWDDIPKDRQVSGIYVATFDGKTLTNPTVSRVVTLLGTDADAPKLVVRPGGYWLFWIARRPEWADPSVSTGPAHSGKGGSRESPDPARYRGEDLAYKWIEVVPLDERGALAGGPRRLGSDRGHVLVYDVAEGHDGAAVVMWRDDDTPTGSTGGRLLRAQIRLGGVDGPDGIEDDHLGAGAPQVMRGWLAVSDAATPTRLVPLALDGRPTDPLASEALVGNGEPLAASGDVLLVSRPSGLAMKLLVVKCRRARDNAGLSDTGSHERD